MNENKVVLVSPWWQRVIHGFFDYSIIWWLSDKLLSLYFKKFAFTQDFFWIQISFVSVFVLFVLYFFFFEYLFSTTPGKFITKNFLIGINNSKPSGWQVLKRTVARLAFIDPLSFVAKNPVGLHDAISGTRVVRKKDLIINVESRRPSGFWLFFQRFVLGLSFFVVLMVVVSPAFLFHRWETPNQLSVESYEWVEVRAGDLKLLVPGKLKERRGEDRWQVSVGPLSGISITSFPLGSEPAGVLFNSLKTARSYTLSSVNLIEYEEHSSSSALWYRYVAMQVPLDSVGYFIETGSRLYRVDFQGFKTEGGDILRKMFSYSLEQSM